MNDLTPHNEKYTPDMPEKIITAAAEGAHIAGQIMAIGIKSRSTWYAYQKEYPEFAAAVEFAKIVSQDYWERLGLKAVKGEIDGFQGTTYALIMNNKFKDEYTRSTNGGSGTEITINTVNYNAEQTTQKIAQKWEKLKNLGWDPFTSGEAAPIEEGIIIE